MLNSDSNCSHFTYTIRNKTNKNCSIHPKMKPTEKKKTKKGGMVQPWDSPNTSMTCSQFKNNNKMYAVQYSHTMSHYQTQIFVSCIKWILANSFHTHQQWFFTEQKDYCDCEMWNVSVMSMTVNAMKNRHIHESETMPPQNLLPIYKILLNRKMTCELWLECTWVAQHAYVPRKRFQTLCSRWLHFGTNKW